MKSNSRAIVACAQDIKKKRARKGNYCKFKEKTILRVEETVAE